MCIKLFYDQNYINVSKHASNGGGHIRKLYAKFLTDVTDLEKH